VLATHIAARVAEGTGIAMDQHGHTRLRTLCGFQFSQSPARQCAGRFTPLRDALAFLRDFGGKAHDHAATTSAPVTIQNTRTLHAMMSQT